MSKKLKKKDLMDAVDQAKVNPRGWVRKFHDGLLTIYNPNQLDTFEVSGVLNEVEITAALKDD